MKSVFRMAVALAAAAACSSAFAALGQSASSIAQDGTPVLSSVQARQFAQTSQSTSGAGASFTVQTVQDEAIVISEYVRTDDSTVFAIRFAGPYLPNLQKLLGTYFPQARDALHEQVQRAPVHDVSTSDLVLHEQGFMGSFSGYAYVPQYVPQGFDVTALSN